MSLKNIEREYSDTRRTLAAFLCFLAAFICFEAAANPSGNALMRTLGPIDNTWVIAGLGGVLLSIGSSFPLYNLWRSSRRDG